MLVGSSLDMLRQSPGDQPARGFDGDDLADPLSYFWDVAFVLRRRDRARIGRPDIGASYLVADLIGEPAQCEQPGADREVGPLRGQFARGPRKGPRIARRGAG